MGTDCLLKTDSSRGSVYSPHNEQFDSVICLNVLLTYSYTLVSRIVKRICVRSGRQYLVVNWPLCPRDVTKTRKQYCHLK